MSIRLNIINDALLGTGNNQLNAEYDGSAEWRAAESSYRRALAYLLGAHSWNFASNTVALGSRLPSSPHAQYTSAYVIPADALHIDQVLLNGVPIDQYDIADGKIVSRYDSGLSVRYYRMPSADRWPVGFVELATMKVEAFLLRSLNEESDNARRRDAEVEALLADMRARSDAQTPARAVFRSRSGARRLTRGGR